MTAVYIETMSIQEYVYSSNKLRENLGASHIVAHYVYEDLLEKALKEIGMQESNDYDLKSWKTSPESRPTKACEAAYIGGGNATLFFHEPDNARKFIKSFSRLVLEYFPGLKLATAIKEDFVLEDFVEERNKLHKILISNRNRNYREVAIPKHGINRDCPKTGDGADVAHYIENKLEAYVSKGAYQKIEAAKASQNKINEKFSVELGNGYIFGNELDKFGQYNGKSYIAIVHIDGNGMGEKFMKAKSLQILRELSVAVSNAAEDCMRKLVGYVVGLMPELEKDKSMEFRWEDFKKVVPFRPIIVGGDDITFVCEGTLGVHLAEKTIEYLNAAINEALKVKKLLKEGEVITSCAGIAIVKTKYPFFRAYHLAEELINAAKRRAKPEMEGGKKSSCIDFYISSSGFAGDLETIKVSTQSVMIDKTEGHFLSNEDREKLERKYKDTPSKLPKNDGDLLRENSDDMSLHYGPYAVGDIHNSNIPRLDQVKRGIRDFKKNWPKNKIMALRDALRGSSAERAYFLEEMKAKGLTISKKLGSLTDSPIPLYEIKIKPTKEDENKYRAAIETPLYDIIDLMDFYPASLLNELNHE